MNFVFACRNPFFCSYYLLVAFDYSIKWILFSLAGTGPTQNDYVFDESSGYVSLSSYHSVILCTWYLYVLYGEYICIIHMCLSWRYCLWSTRWWLTLNNVVSYITLSFAFLFLFLSVCLLSDIFFLQVLLQQQFGILLWRLFWTVLQCSIWTVVRHPLFWTESHY